MIIIFQELIKITMEININIIFSFVSMRTKDIFNTLLTFTNGESSIIFVKLNITFAKMAYKVSFSKELLIYAV